MAVLVMAETPPQKTKPDCKKEDATSTNPIFHDFFGSLRVSHSHLIPKQIQTTDFTGEMKLTEASSAAGGHAPVSATSDLASGERQMNNHFQGVPVHNLNADFTGPESGNRFIGRKRSNSDSAFMGLGPRDKMTKIGSDSLESLHLMKMLHHSNVVEDHTRRSHDEELGFGMQLPKANSTSHFLSQPPPGTKSDSVPSKWERSMSNVGALAQYPSRFSQYATYPDKLSSRDSKAGPSVISPPAADEGSRTGKKGSGIFNTINATNGVERHTSEGLISNQRPNSATQSGNPEPSDPPRERVSKSASRQMTIFYGGQAHVFDEVPPNKADVIMALAGSNGASWSTSYTPKPSLQPSHNEIYIPNRENGPGLLHNLGQEQQGRLTIPGKPVHRFTQGGGPVLATTGDPLNTVSVGGHMGSITLRPSRSFNQSAEANRKEKHEV